MSIHRHYKEVADICGVNASLLFQHIAYWVEQNRKAGKHMHAGRYWMYATVRELASDVFTYFTENQVRDALKKLRDHELILTGNFNKTAYDRTMWYTLSDEGERILRKAQFQSGIMRKGDL